MTVNLLEEAGRVEITCDGCGRVMFALPAEEHENAVNGNPLKEIRGLRYCDLCTPRHEERVAQEDNSYAARHLQARETIADPEELERVLADLDREYGVNRTDQNT